MDLSHHASSLAVPDTAYVHEWVDSTSELPVVDKGDVDESLAARLYAGCIIVLRRLCSQTAITDASHSYLEPWVLGQELGRMYLWGEGLGNGKLDKALSDADELRVNVLEVLGSIAMLLVRSKLIFLRFLQFEQNLSTDTVPSKPVKVSKCEGGIPLAFR